LPADFLKKKAAGVMSFIKREKRDYSLRIQTRTPNKKKKEQAHPSDRNPAKGTGPDRRQTPQQQTPLQPHQKHSQQNR
jgi:hypothetical protein